MSGGPTHAEISPSMALLNMWAAEIKKNSAMRCRLVASLERVVLECQVQRY
jgi:hypothetical protein